MRMRGLLTLIAAMDALLVDDHEKQLIAVGSNFTLTCWGQPTAARPTPTPTLSAHVCTLAIMKRCLSDGHDCNVSHSSAPGTRRRRTQRADPTGARAATEQDDIQHWLHSSDATPEWPATMAAPPTPRSASRTSAGVAAPNAVRAPTARARLARARSLRRRRTARVESLHELPVAIDVEARRSLDLESWGEPV